jgi:hypothetical protein
MVAIRGTASLLACCLAAQVAHADPRAAAPAPRVSALAPTAEPDAQVARIGAATAPAARRVAIYGEALGKGGPWGIGVDVSLGRRLGIGAVGSFVPLDGQRLLVLSPYLSVYPLGGARHRWFVDAGPQLINLATPSPVPEWKGTSSTGLGGEVSSGYEYRGRVFVRAYGMAVIGKHGPAPWLGLSMGWSL